ncbi:glycoside hydrolase family 2 protein [Dysgonomonas sp. 216]|uniref:glycoside hydrolase family 2 protein n=1 Tax=Dysgonomonas sp. 216 TaxID=2302934 RepID=UPI0013CFC05F|nr:sugar-binding domain-containing protein [Dysgonomonas sp. 216]NDW19114.1 glycoside hydrolase family 2 protein [Dysgonomonas sp. 216]
MNKNLLLKYLLFFILTVCAQTPASGATFKGNKRVKYNFNMEWMLHIGDLPEAYRVKYDDASWKKVTLPRAFNEDDAFKVAIDEHTTDIVWYRKHFRLPAKDKGSKIFLEFEGIRFGGEFFINGTSVGIHENGVMACGFDISDYVNFGGKENIVAVRIDNSWEYKEKATNEPYQWNDKNFNANYGGIPKNVYLHVTDKVYQTLPLYSNLKTTGTYVYAREINISGANAMVYAESEVKNETSNEKEITYEVVIEDMDGGIVKRMVTSSVKVPAGEIVNIKVGDRVNNLNFWSWGYGYLYNVYTILNVNGVPTDVVKTRTGFRKTAFRDGLIKLNDRTIQVKGYAQRTSNEWPAVGMSVPAWLSDYSNKLIVEGNGNLVRWMHVTPWKQDVESCDRVGLMQAMPAGDAEKDVDGRRWEQRLELMRDAIIYNRNNPSVIFYESGNESISEEHMAQMKEIRDKYDPYGGRAIGSREMLDSKIAEYGGEMLYINKSAHIPMWATEYCRDEALRKYWDDYSFPYHKDGEGLKYYRSTVTNTIQKNVDASAYNRNQDSFFVETIRRWFDYFRVRPGTGKRVSSGGTNIIFSDSNTHYRGSENFRRSGEVDAMRIPKDAFFAHQVMWDGWVDVENHRSHIAGHWNYQTSTVKDIFVVSSGEQVELFVNGKSKGFGERNYNFLYTFKSVQWEPGSLEAVSYDLNKKELSRHKLSTAGDPVAIRMKEMHAPDGFLANGNDLALVEIEVIDKDGKRCPLANNMISFKLDGPAEWRGGLAQGVEGNYILSQELPVECGVNRVLIRSTTKSGTIKLTATSKGLESASVSLTSKPFAFKNGLSEYISGEHQPVFLSRGATPKGESYNKMTRTPIGISGATAGSNEDKVALSYDDNELSEWSNDGRLSTGWIKYELERDAVVSQVELKLSGWRIRSYPIQIFVDDVEVYKGETDKSLGYVCIPVTPTKGRLVKIQLIGLSSDEDAFGGIIEVTGNKELDLYKDPKALDSKGQLRIVEAEFYE